MYKEQKKKCGGALQMPNIKLNLEYSGVTEK